MVVMILIVAVAMLRLALRTGAVTVRVAVARNVRVPLAMFVELQVAGSVAAAIVSDWTVTAVVATVAVPAAVAVMKIVLWQSQWL